MLSDSIQQQLEELRLSKAPYTPNPSVAISIANKALIMLVGPVAAGKTYVISQAAHIDPDFAAVSTLTTREARTDDHPGMFRNVPHDDQHIRPILQKVHNRELVSYAIHPITGHIYATEPRDFPAKYNMLATLSQVAETFATLPFEHTYVIGVAADVPAWKARLAVRYPKTSDERQKRLQEAIISLEWLLSHDINWIDNSNDNDDAAARQLVNLVKYNKTEDTIARAHASDMLMLARRMI